MGTRGRVGVMHGDKCKSVYVHWDSYLDGVGRILLEHYDSSKANHLVALGDLSSLHPNIGEKHDFDDRAAGDNQCTFYGRDRKETGTEFKTDSTFEAFLERVDGCCGEWDYVMRDGVWYVGNMYERDTKFYKQLVPLAEALETVKETA